MPSLSTCTKRVPWQGSDGTGTPSGLERALLLRPVILLLQAQGARILDWLAVPGLTVKLESVIGDGSSPLRLKLAGLGSQRQFHHVGRCASSPTSWWARGWIGNSK